MIKPSFSTTFRVEWWIIIYHAYYCDGWAEAGEPVLVDGWAEAGEPVLVDGWAEAGEPVLVLTLVLADTHW